MSDPAITTLFRQRIRERNGHFMHELCPDWKKAYIELAEECGHSFWLTVRFIAGGTAAEKETVLHATISVYTAKPADMDGEAESVWKLLRLQALAVWLSYVDAANFKRFAENRIASFEAKNKEGLDYAY